MEEEQASGKTIVIISQPHIATKISPYARFIEKRNNLDIYLYRKTKVDP